MSEDNGKVKEAFDFYQIILFYKSPVQTHIKYRTQGIHI